MVGKACAVAVLLILAGCAAPAPEEETTDETQACAGEELCSQGEQLAQDGRDLRFELRANDTLPAPVWEVGDVFEQHMFFGAEDREGLHVRTMVIDDGDGYLVATDDPDAARFDSVFDYPVLGRIGEGLETTFFGADWSWMFDFPLTDGKTWTGSADDVINWNSYNFTDITVELTATYDGAIDAAGSDRPGYWIEGTTPDGKRLMRYSYVPAIGWFSHLWLYDVETPAPEDIMFHAMSMGTWKNYTGGYHVAEATSLVEHFYGTFPDPSGPVQGDPAPQTFDVPGDADHIVGIAVPIAFGGRSEIRVSGPAGTDTYSYQQADLEGRGFDVEFIDKEATAGEHQSQIIAAGVASGGFLWLNAVTLATASMG